MPATAKVTPIRSAELPVTEDSLACVFADEFRDRARYDHHSGKWFLWDGHRWLRNETMLALEWCRGLCRRFGALDNELGKSLGKAGTIAGVERLARVDARLAVTSEAFDTDTMLLGTPGGTVDLRDGSIRRPSPGDYITKAAAVAPAPPGAYPRRWLQFLAEATDDDEEVVAFLKAVAGYCLTGQTIEHSLFFVYGPGGNGKSVFLNTIAWIMGDYAATAPMETFTEAQGDRHPTDLAMLRGARLVTAAETEEGRAWAESRIKQLTGGDLITARFMRQDFFTYRPIFKLLIIGNHKPVLRNVDEAARRRFRLIPFLLKPRTPNPRLEEELRAEAPAILRWMIDGCLDWQEGRLPVPTAVQAETKRYFDDQDVLAQWLGDCCELDPPGMAEPIRRCLSSKLFASWSGWCQRNGEQAGTNKRLSQDLERRGFAKQASKFGKEFKGLTIKPGGSE